MSVVNLFRKAPSDTGEGAALRRYQVRASFVDEIGTPQAFPTGQHERFSDALEDMAEMVRLCADDQIFTVEIEDSATAEIVFEAVLNRDGVEQ